MLLLLLKELCFGWNSFVYLSNSRTYFVNILRWGVCRSCTNDYFLKWLKTEIRNSKSTENQGFKSLLENIRADVYRAKTMFTIVVFGENDLLSCRETETLLSGCPHQQFSAI